MDSKATFVFWFWRQGTEMCTLDRIGQIISNPRWSIVTNRVQEVFLNKIWLHFTIHIEIGLRRQNMQWANQWFCSPFDTFGTREKSAVIRPTNSLPMLFVFSFRYLHIDQRNQQQQQTQHIQQIYLLFYLCFLFFSSHRSCFFIVPLFNAYSYWSAWAHRHMPYNSCILRFCHADKMLWIAAFCIVGIDFCHNDDDRHDRLYIFLNVHITQWKPITIHGPKMIDFRLEFNVFFLFIFSAVYRLVSQRLQCLNELIWMWTLHWSLVLTQTHTRL